MIEKTSSLGWPNTARLANSHAELLITRDVGPRILSYKTTRGSNVFKIYEDQLGGSGENGWMIRGGHRLWVAPEDTVVTYELDNVPVESRDLGESGIELVNKASEHIGISKKLTVHLVDAQSSHVRVQHSVKNEGREPRCIASWALSVMAPGGVEIIPLPELGEHPRHLLPNRRMVAWPYTDLRDPRYTFGTRYIRLSQRDGLKPTKLGLAHTEKWVAYHANGALFVKTFDFEPGVEYPDLGCNFETFTADGMLEIESLGPLRNLEPDESTEHTEHWWVFDAPTAPPENEEALSDWMSTYLAQTSAAGS